jgi:aldose 1-epimerase
VKKTDFGHGPNGEPVYLFTLESGNGISAQITNYGGIITHLYVPDKGGKLADVVLGFDSLQPYLDGHPFFGAIVGRTAGRISGGSFSIGGKDYFLPINQAPNHLHGGRVGFDKRVWAAQIVRRANGEGLHLKYRSPAGEEGYPGTVDVNVTYSLTQDGALHIEYAATTDAATPLNLTNHSYFNLRGESSGDISSHLLQVFSDEYTPVDENFSYTGERRSVAGQPNDFRSPLKIGSRLRSLFAGHGDNYMLGKSAFGLVPAARVSDPESGRTMEVFTTERCLQFYTGLNLDGSSIGKSLRPYEKFSGFCLECQGFPDAPNRPAFDSITLHPGHTYRQKTAYRFSSGKP